MIKYFFLALFVLIQGFYRKSNQFWFSLRSNRSIQSRIGSRQKGSCQLKLASNALGTLLDSYFNQQNIPKIFRKLKLFFFYCSIVDAYLIFVTPTQKYLMQSERHELGKRIFCIHKIFRILFRYFAPLIFWSTTERDSLNIQEAKALWIFCFCLFIGSCMRFGTGTKTKGRMSVTIWKMECLSRIT